MRSNCGHCSPRRWPCRCSSRQSPLFWHNLMPAWTACWRPRPSQRYHCPMDTRLLELLVCPVTKGPLEYDREKQELTSRSARLAYPMRDALPILLESEARTLSDEELGL